MKFLTLIKQFYIIYRQQRNRRTGSATERSGTRSLRKTAPLGRLEAHLHDDRCREGRTAVERDIGQGFLDMKDPQYPKNVETF